MTPMLCIHILRSSIFEAMLLAALKAGQRHVGAAPARQESVGSVSEHWGMSWVVLCSAILTVLVLKVSGKRSHLA
jgi:hypothetical protein